ncbi:hypothetical protein AAP_04328 [Ascosphaera apis ARSEF 7405]|uniref:Uncharacterized protein n=1 Tax=Ascosphaera apis ARSEF 7405 TaxID=392613 RepID=A0A162I7B2_9EURO|nr:hypothetical protein AAP_04328 [Ascosphaera apis ARSEF 7405]
MFEATEAKQIGRDELLPSRTPTPEPVDPEAATYAAAAFQQLFGQLETIDVATDRDSAAGVAGDAEEEEQEFEFRLFSAPQPSNKQEQQVDATAGTTEGEAVQKLKIRLRSPSPGAEGDGGFVVPFRGWDYYLSAPDVTLKGTALESAIAARINELKESHVQKSREYANCAVSFEEIAHFASLQKPGCRLSWRVINLKPSTPKSKKQQNGSKASADSNSAPDSKQYLENPWLIPHVPKSRNKPGKKRRIVLRQRALAKKQAEEADREKRTARNREKKLKRRQREREKKAAERAVEGGSLVIEAPGSPEDVSMVTDE